MTGMQGRIKWVALLGIVLTICTGMTAMASGSVRIRFESSSSSWADEIVEPTVTVNGQAETPEWSRDVEKWTPGKRVTATIYVSGTFSKSNCSVSGGELVSVTSEDGETTIRASYTPVIKLGSPESAGWSDAKKTRASWKKVPYAQKYQLRLYQDSSWVKTLTTTASTIDLVEYMRDGYQYYYEVRAIAKSSSEQKYLKDGEYTLSDDSVVQELGDTSGRWSTYQEGKKYRDESGNYVSSAWRMITGKWYYFNQSGYAMTNWQIVADKWYYMNSDGEMQTGWQKINEKWYYLGTDGAMQTGWIQPSPSEWYYLSSDGSMAVSTTIDGYTVDASGRRVQ